MGILIMKDKIKALVKRLSQTRLEPVFRMFFNILAEIEYAALNFIWKIKGYRRETPGDIRLVCDNVTFMFKSFERQKDAKRLYKNIRHRYPTAKIVIADDSRIPLEINDDCNLSVVHLPFNSGLSKGLNKAIEQVHTPYVMRMDDDERLTAASRIADELKFLINHKNVDLTGFLFTSPPLCHNIDINIPTYKKYNMGNAPKQLIIPHMTVIDKKHIVMGKVPNIWLARTDKVKEIGWDDNIRMIDHHEFFYRCAGNLVCVLSTNSVIWHQHNPFNEYYHQYRRDFRNDGIYIYKKHGKEYLKRGSD